MHAFFFSNMDIFLGFLGCLGPEVTKHRYLLQILDETPHIESSLFLSLPHFVFCVVIKRSYELITVLVPLGTSKQGNVAQ